MAITDANYKTLIALEIGDTPGNVIATNIDLLWNIYADKAQISAHLQYLYAKRHAIDLILPTVRERVTHATTTAELSTNSNSESDKFRFLEAMRRDVQAEIDKVESRAAGVRAPAVGAITTTTPNPSPVNAPDANDTRYRGDPNFTIRTWQP